jgi:hypothetical protein
MAAAVSYRPTQWLAPLLPARSPLQLVISAWVPEVFLPLLLALFVSEFPRVRRWSAADRLARVAIRLSLGAGALCAIGHVVAASYSPLSPQASRTLGWMARTHSSQAYWLILLIPAALSLALMLARRRHAEGEERRRGSLFMAGLALGFAPAILVIVSSATIPFIRRLLDDPSRLELIAFVTYGLTLSIPFTTAYAIRAHRVFSVRFVLRGTVRRLLARSTLSVATLVPAALLAAHMLRHRDQSLALLFSGSQSMLSLGLTALGLLGIATRVPLGGYLDRTLSPRRGDARTSLFRANQGLRQVRSPEEVLDVLLREVDATLGVAGAVLRPGPNGYSSLDGRIQPIPEDSALARLLLSADGPVLVDPLSRASIFRWLPDTDRAWVIEAGVATLLSVPGNPRPRALLALESPRDGDPCTGEDFLYLGALATAGGMALETASAERAGRVLLTSDAEDVAGECPACGLVHSRRSTSCRCGSHLEAALLPPILSGKFRLSRRLGAGAMGVVYEAEDLDLDRTVALKTLPRISPELALRLRREARSMARVLHPRLAMIFGCEEWRGVPVLVMEHLAGTLSTRLGRPWRVQEALEVGVAAAEGLVVMHDHGLLHRDVKPSNVGFSQNGDVKLLDFGIAHLLTGAVAASTLDTSTPGQPVSTDMDLSNRWIGTPLYCSPERLNGASATAADDVWSLSVLLYELLAGQHPWRRQDGSIAPGRFPELGQWRSDCPTDIARFFARTLAPRPADRPASASDLRSGLVTLLRERPTARAASA